MEDAQIMRSLKTIGDLHAAGQHQLHACGTFSDHLVQALARNVLHDDVGLIVFLADLIDRAHVGMIDR